ncbi:MAG: toxin-antitoxin system HicB family antitoxin [Chloroflexi bacterium]|nr:toxin-antitoxin system HicB family antitoxin [Chloroflexota bacterium]
MVQQRSLDEYLAREYPFQVLADPDGGYVIVFPDLPGCLSQADTLDEIPAMAEDARRAWMTAAYEDGDEIPPPSYPEEYSGKFNVRLPKSLHRALAEGAARQGVSLNQYVVDLLARGDAQAQVEHTLQDIESRLTARLKDLARTVGAPHRPPELRDAADKARGFQTVP